MIKKDTAVEPDAPVEAFAVPRIGDERPAAPNTHDHTAVDEVTPVCISDGADAASSAASNPGGMAAVPSQPSSGARPAPAAAPAASTRGRPDPGVDTQNLRIAPVVVGGVSLAVWMGGLMSELEKVTRKASGYDRLLNVLDVDVDVDVLSGTSAGGINAAAFALARRRGGSVGALRDLWLRIGSLDNLLRNPYEKSPRSLMRGDEVMLAELAKAFTSMSDDANADDGSLRLFLTATYLRGEPSRYRDDYGTLIADVKHAALFEFDEDQLKPGSDEAARALALAARTSASFPYAFEPSRLLLAAPTGKNADPNHPGMAAYLNASANHFAVDGGALVNRPLGPALQAIFDRTSDRPVRRVLAYITPTSAGTVAPSADETAPLLGKVMEQTLGAMLAQSISSDLDRLREHNSRVGALRTTRQQLARLASAGVPLVDATVWDAYVDDRARREAQALLDAATKLIRAAGADGNVQQAKAWAVQLDGIQPVPRRWTETLVDTRRRQLDGASRAIVLSGSARCGPPVELGFELYESAVAAALPLYSLVLGALRAAGRWDLVAKLGVARSALAQARRAARPPARASAFEAVRGSLGPNKGGLPVEADVTDFLADVATTWPPAPSATLAGAWTSLAKMVTALSSYLDAVVPAGAQVGRDQVDFKLAASDARPILDYLTAADAAAGEPDATTVEWRLADLVVAQQALGAPDLVDQPVELVQMTADTRTELLRGNGNSYSHSAASQKLAGLQLHHFGAFYKAAWRANDWMWGRLDGAGWLVHVLLDPVRIRQRFSSSAEFLSSLRKAGLLPNEADQFVTAERLAQATRKLDEVFTATPPASLPDLAMLVAAPLQARIAAEELPVVADEIRVDAPDGLVEVHDKPFLAVAQKLSAVVSEKAPDPADLGGLARQALAACNTGQQTIRQDAGSHRFVTTASTAAAVVASTLDSAVVKLPGPVSRLMKSLRSVTLMMFVMAKGLRRTGVVGLIAGAAVAVAGTSSGWVQTGAVAASALLLLLLLTFGLRAGENRAIPVVVLIVVGVALLAFVALAGLWPEPVKNWPLDAVEHAVTWLRSRWWALAILVFAALAWLLLPVLRVQPARHAAAKAAEQAANGNARVRSSAGL